MSLFHSLAPQPFSNLSGNSEPLKKRSPERRQLQTGRTSCVCQTLLVTVPHSCHHPCGAEESASQRGGVTSLKSHSSVVLEQRPEVASSISSSRSTGHSQPASRDYVRGPLTCPHPTLPRLPFSGLIRILSLTKYWWNHISMEED